MKISAAIARSIETPYSIETCDITDPADGEVLVKVHACGVCHTDSAVKLGHLPVEFPAILGHEGAGVVEKVGPSVIGFEPGDHVLMSFGNCGSCPSCDAGAPTYCHQFGPLNFPSLRPDATPTHSQDGTPVSGRFFSQSSFATYAIATPRNTVKIEKDLPLDILAPLGCGIQTGMGAVLNVLHPTAGQSIAVFGTGSVGLSAIMAAKIANCGVIVAVDINPARLELAQELGATHTIDPSSEEVMARIGEISPTLMNLAFDTTGNSQAAESAFNCLGLKGTVAYVGAPPMGTGFNVDMNTLVGTGRTIRGVIEGDAVPSVFIPQMIDYYRRGQLPLEKLITHFPFDQINDAVEAAEGGKVVKAVLTMA